GVLGHGFRQVFVTFPAWLASLPLLQRIVRSWAFQLSWQYLFKPLLLCLPLWLSWPEWFFTQPNALGQRPEWFLLASFLLSAFLVTSPVGQGVSELMTEACLRLYQWLRADFLGGLLRLIIRVFKQCSDTMEYVLYTVDELLRFRSGDSMASMALR